MRILTNFSKKVSTGDYENETFTVTMECDTEFNDIAEVADYLFKEAEAAVSRQLESRTNGNGKPVSTLPDSVIQANKGNGRNGSGIPSQFKRKQGNGNRKNGGMITESQRRYLFRLLAERGIEGDEALSTLTQILKVSDLDDVTKSQASKLIDDMVKQAA
jgi:hypothetical protein